MKKAAFLIAAILSGCGGAGTDTISGRVADGYIRGAIVFWDCNGNKIPDPSEVQTITGSGGSFTISTAPSSSCTLVAKVPIGAIDEDAPSAPVDRSYTLVSTKGNESFISPLSTMVAAHMEQNPSASIADSEFAVATAFGITGNLNTDYIAVQAGDAVVRRGVAKIATAVLQNNNLPGQTLQGVSQAYTSLQSLAPTIKAADFANPNTVPDIINPVTKFLAITDTSQFLNTGSFSVRPSSTASYSESVLQALDNVLLHSYMVNATRMGVVNYEDISYNDLVSLKGELEAAGVLLDENSPIVLYIRKLRDADGRAINAKQAAEVDGKNTWFNSDIAANLSFWTTVAVSEVDGVTNAIAIATDLPVNVDMRRFNGRPVRKSVVAAFQKYGLWDTVSALATVVENSGKLLSEESKAAINSGKSSSSEGSGITREQFKVLGELIEASSGLVLQIIKDNEFASKGKALFGGTFATIGAISGDCKTTYNADCLSDSLSLVESVAEWIHVGTRLKAIIGEARAGMDAYLAGVEYAAVTDKIVVSDQYKVMEYWASKTKQSQKYWLLVELAARGVDNLYEAYDPSVPCTAKQVRLHGACVDQGSLSEDFSGSSIDTSKWNIDGAGDGIHIGPVGVANGLAEFGAWGRISTKAKVTFSGSKIVIEARMAGQGGSRDTAMNLVDTVSGDLIVSGDTNYFSFGFYAMGSGEYGVSDGFPRPDTAGARYQRVGTSINQFMEYRWTLSGNMLTMERGPTLANITDRATATLGRSISGRSFYLSIGTASPSYSPGTWDWVRVTTQ